MRARLELCIQLGRHQVEDRGVAVDAKNGPAVSEIGVFNCIGCLKRNDLEKATNRIGDQCVCVGFKPLSNLTVFGESSFG